ncbi:MAG: molybdopterin-binding protein, partial [Candidatus Freyarchaeota archaeon]
DDPETITTTLKEAINRKPDYIITTGGLGSTYDDMTMSAVAKAVNKPLQVNRKLLKDIENKFNLIHKLGKTKNSRMTPERKKLAYVPRGSQIYLNPVGLAPATLVKTGKTKIITLPGFPQEVKALFEKHLIPLLKKAVKEQYNHPEVWIKSQPQRDKKITTQIYLTAHGKNAKTAVQNAKKELQEKIKINKNKRKGKK